MRNGDAELSSATRQAADSPDSAPHTPHSAILITGGKGQLGRALAARYADAGAVALGRDDLDVTDRNQVEATVERIAPSLIVHAAAATDVDRCEREPEFAFRLNTLATRYLAAAAGDRDIPFVYVSTNYVFAGEKPPGEAYHEWDAPGPISVYGRAKLAGEEETRRHARRHLIVRTANVYAAQGRKFVQVMLRMADEGRASVGGVADQWGQPTFATDLAEGIAALAATGAWGTYHLTNAGACTWAEWAVEIFRLSGRQVMVEPIPAATFKRDATPPANGVMANVAAAALGVALPDWREGLRRCLGEMGELQD
jgi:dTDP-4-dehydrorhamnose reductase